MQKAAVSSALLPILLEQVFKRFSNSSLAGKRDIEKFLLDLHKLLGKELVAAALRIIDRKNIVIYTNNLETIEVAEICNETSPFRFVRLFPKINYCTCEYFKENVLIKKDTCTAQYTCQHMLAIRLATILQHKCLQFKEVPSHNLDLLLTSFVSTRSEEE